MKEETIKIEGIKCMGCVNTVSKAISGLPGIEKVEVSLDKKEAFIIFDESEISLQEIKEEILKSGYSPE